MKIIDKGSITSVPGIKATGIYCGIKKKGKDLALIVSDVTAISAAVFTTNKVTAAPVKLSKKLIKKGKTRAILVNSGNANACTGKEGYKNAEETIHLLSKKMQIPSHQILIASTGKIGELLPMEKIRNGMSRLTSSISINGGASAAEAIMTTDLVTKSIAVSYEMDGRTIVIGGIAKGSGMIYPKMATMLSFITTNIGINQSTLQRVLKKSVDLSYNMITVDGDTSTNDSVFCLANGFAGNKSICKGKKVDQFFHALTFVNTHLAKMIVADGEGATKFIEITVCGVENVADAKTIAFAIANSSLVKTAFFGEDPNWGRIISSAGASLEQHNSLYDFEKVTLCFGDYQVVRKGEVNTAISISKVKSVLQQKDIAVLFDLHRGKSQATVWTTDLSYDYVKINAEYHT